MKSIRSAGRVMIAILSAMASPAFAQSRPIGATMITASAIGTTGVTTATLPAAAGVTTYICGFSIDANATTAVFGNATITGTISGTMNFTQPVGTAPAVGTLNRIFSPCIPGSAINTAIAVNSIAP